MTSSNGKLFHVLALCAGISPVASEFSSQRPVTRSFDVYLICAWIYGWVNNGDAGDLRRHLAHYDVTVMTLTLVYKERPFLSDPPNNTFVLWAAVCVIAYNHDYSDTCVRCQATRSCFPNSTNNCSGLLLLNPSWVDWPISLHTGVDLILSRTQHTEDTSPEKTNKKYILLYDKDMQLHPHKK